jgi:hypothetical protein
VGSQAERQVKKRRQKGGKTAWQADKKGKKGRQVDNTRHADRKNPRAGR